MRLRPPSLALALALGVLAASAAAAEKKKPKPAAKPAPAPAAIETLESAATIVVYNANAPDSEALATFYAEKRAIPKERIIGLRCAVTEQIERLDYDATIAEPLRELFTKNGWWELRPGDETPNRVVRNRIRFVALIRGIPLKINGAANYPGDRSTGDQLGAHNEAAVDSELTTLGGFNRVISGPMNNPYYRGFVGIFDAPLPGLLLVSRLDAPTPEIVRRMITDSIAAEREGLRGFAYIDARNIQSAGYAEGDQWLYNAADNFRRRGVPVVMDNGEALFPAPYPMTRAALYFGWYTGYVAGPFVRSDFRFVRGAVAVHIHSFSASTLRDQKLWCPGLLAAGAAATLGNVFEPYLTLTPQLDILNERLRSGFTFAESAWMSLRAVSWQNTVIGDPLYRPFRFLNDLDAKRGSGEWDAYRDGARMWFEKNRASGEAALRASAKRMRSGIIWEGLGLLELTTNDGLEAALNAFREARSAYTTPDDIVRVTVHEVMVLKGMNRGFDIAVLIDKVTRAYPNTRATEVLKMLL
jgi:uncharacterized protein (TIGR03790 family)